MLTPGIILRASFGKRTSFLPKSLITRRKEKRWQDKIPGGASISRVSPWVTIVLLIAAFASTACYEEDMTISIDGRLPPTFRLSGSGNLIFFAVSEVIQDNVDREQAGPDRLKLIWQILPTGLSSSETIIRKLPSITYGSIPKGFVQKIPQNGVPPDLMEGKTYKAGGPASNANGGFVWFKIEQGKVVQLDPPGGQ